MEFFEAAAKRHSYRGKFTDQAIPQENLKKILLAGIQAPSGHNRQTTSFVVVTEPELRAELNHILPHKGVATAPVVIVPLSTYVETFNGMAFELQDYSVAVENILLAVTALGYATVWTEGYMSDPAKRQAVAKLLNVPAGKTVRCLLPIGVPEEHVEQAARAPFEERVHFNKF